MSEPRAGRPEWYERLRTDDSFPGRTFTSEKIAQIERIAFSGKAVTKARRLRIGAMAGAAVCVIGLAIWFVAIGPIAGSGGTSDRAAITSQGPGGTEPAPTPSAAPREHRIFLKGPAHALPVPNAAYSVFEATTSESYELLDAGGDYIQIKGELGSGWIPMWYSNGGEAATSTVQSVQMPYSMIVDKPGAYRLYPDEPNPSNSELWTGKVVQVVGTYGNEWLEINVVTYDSPNSANKWVRKDELIPYDAGEAREGLAYPPAKSAVTLYNMSGEAQQELPPLTPVYIKGEQGDRYWILAAGGISGYMDKADFSPDPFSVPSTERPSSSASNTKYLKGNVIVHAEPGPNGSYSPFVALTTGTYSIGETRDGYIRITDRSGQTGWIPQWYSMDEEKGPRVENVIDPYEMIVDKPVKYRMYPDEPTPSGFELWEGKVVQVVGKYGDWLEINVVTYDSPYMENKWVRKDELIPYEESKAKEGFVFASDAMLYDENGVAQQVLPVLTNVFIEGEQGDRYKIIAGGGISGYLKKMDFVANPFSIKVVDQ